MATQLNCNATTNGLMYDWKSVLDEGWYNPALLQILSFHNSAGLEIVDTTTIADASILLSVVDGNLANCRKLDVPFVRVQITLDYATLFATGHTGPTSIKSMYYIELPNTIAPMINGNGIAYNLSTYHGPADIRTMTAAKVLTKIVDPCLQMGPITLENADFNLAAANIDTSKHRDLLNSKILQLGFKQICAAMFRQLCPSYSDQPHAVIKHIRQSAPGPDGQLIVASVHEYFQRLQNTSKLFAARKTLPIDLCGRFIIGLDRHLILSFRRLYPNHADMHDLSSAAQHAKLPIILAAAQLPEDEVHQLQDIARSITGGQGFHI